MVLYIYNFQVKIQNNNLKLNMNEDKIINKLLEHDEKLEAMITKEEFNQFRLEILASQDEMVTILRRLDQEMVFTAE